MVPADPADAQPADRRATRVDRDAVFRGLRFATLRKVPSLEKPTFDLARVPVADVGGPVAGAAR